MCLDAEIIATISLRHSRMIAGLLMSRDLWDAKFVRFPNKRASACAVSIVVLSCFS